MEQGKERDSVLEQIFQFFDEISIQYNFTEIETETFLPGIQIKNGVLQIDLQKLKYPGDLVHEAGHIAVTKSEEREVLNDNVIENNAEKAGEEMAVLLWSYAAAKNIGLAPEIVFHEDGYKGEAEWLREQFVSENYIGLPLLQWMGMTDVEGGYPFPKMKVWLRE
ncbi:MAG: hypothetical protein CL528_00555 [Aequorivita sp.]|jgi:hypothetical protein|nr:hypothetical protein [Aequorivita sp.]MBP40241.1 hypothetical protein [Aequorivita sp.]HBC04616.1 hypothetical protein [Aequorivita sp.]|tara:strand:+ start:834 stop:1328 length:495 start_codon:yes stop_codon:yes gene_type:complete